MAVVLILLVFVGTTLLLGRFGIDNLEKAMTFPGRITGAVLVAVSLTTLLGAAAVVDHWFWNSFAYSGVVALFAASVAFLANAVLLMEIWDGDSPPYQAELGMLTAGSGWAAFTLWRTSAVIPTPKRLAAALIVPSVIAIANFGYQNLYEPSQHGAKPLIKVTTEKPVLSQNRKEFAVPVDISIENHSNVGFYVLGSEIHAMGERVPLSDNDRLRQQWRTDAEQWNRSLERSPLSRREIHQPGELVAAQPLMGPGHFIEANDAFATRVVVQMPIDAPYDRVAFYASASFARKDRLVLGPPLQFKGYSWDGGQEPQWMKTMDLDAIVYRGRVHENNPINDRTREPRYVTVYWCFGTHGARVSAVIARNGEETTKRETEGRYGLVDADTGPIEQTLWDIKKTLR
ncbi:hypothetical protein [Streptomyces glomeratus]|uniref:DUF2135 domain-containing protein n=1 Tax=Streptomyces glomeratus TaxID=284452 RepID=A0ABP6M3N4_9ACTN|nr:hypothetical protein [Streptomyces glomeratus]MCF1511803.1 hypothetical protein [Streptomyces glomeratus]